MSGLDFENFIQNSNNYVWLDKEIFMLSVINNTKYIFYNYCPSQYCISSGHSF